MSRNYCNFEKSACRISKELAIEFVALGYLKPELIPALERYIATYILNNKEYFEPFLNGCSLDVLAKLIFKKFNSNIRSKDKFIEKIKYHFFYIYRFLIKIRNFLLSKKLNGNILVVSHHAKFIRFFLSKGFNIDGIDWLVLSDKNESRKILNKNNIYSILKDPQKKLIGIPFLDVFNSEYINFKYTLMILNPRKIVVIEGDAPYMSMISDIAKEFNYQSICIQWSIYTEGYGEVFSSGMKFDLFITWGDFFSSNLKKLSPGVNFTGGGNLIYSRNQFSYCEKKLKIVFIGQSTGSFIDRHMQDEFINVALTIAENYKNYLVVFRLHPNTIENYGDLIDGKSNFVCTSGDTLLSEELAEAKVVVSIYSSAIVEAMTLGCIPVILNSTCYSSYPIPLNLYQIGFEVKSSNEALFKISHILDNEVYYQEKKVALSNNLNKIINDDVGVNEYCSLRSLIEGFRIN